MYIQTRLKILIAEKSLREGRKLPYHVIAEETGLNPNTLVDYANSRATRFDERVLITLCQYFACALSDLLVIVEGTRG